jgi:hypothetical protein
MNTIENTMEPVAAEQHTKQVPLEKIARYRQILAPGVYIQATYVPKGIKLYSKPMTQDHIVILAMGKLGVEADGIKTVYQAPAHYTIPAMTRIPVVTLEDSAWYCVHVTEETDLQRLKELY